MTNTPESHTITAPLSGIWRSAVAQDSDVAQGDIIGYVEAIKLDAAVIAPAEGRIHFVVEDDFTDVEGGDLLAELH